MSFLTEPQLFDLLPAVDSPAQAGFAQAWQMQRHVFDQLLSLQPKVDSCADRLANCLGAGGKVLWCGLGTSSATARRLAMRLTGANMPVGRPLASLALSHGSGMLAGLHDDEEVFWARQVQALSRPGDALIILSAGHAAGPCSLALQAARGMGLMLIGIFGGEVSASWERECHVSLRLPDAPQERLEEAELFLGHCLCDQVRALTNAT